MTAKRAILLSVTGMTPQVVTETLYAIVTRHQTVPAEIHVITTSRGKNRILHDLLDSKNGQFHAFCRDYNLTGRIRFDESMIHTIDKDGEALPDIRTPEENALAADCITALVRQFCSDPDAELHVSLAGGRKTMGFFVGSALSLFGRQGDRLSHVLVSDPYENNPDFFYPAQTPREIITQKGDTLDASLAEVMLAEIPFVRLRDGLPDDLITGKLSFSDTVALAQDRIVPPVSVAFRLEAREVVLGRTAVRLAPQALAIYLWMAERKVQGLGPVRPNAVQDVNDFLAVYSRVVGEDSADFINCKKMLTDEEMGTEDLLKMFQEKRTRINARICSVLGALSGEAYKIAPIDRYPRTTWGLTVDASAVTLPAQSTRRYVKATHNCLI